MRTLFMVIILALGAGGVVAGLAVLLGNWDRPDVVATQKGFRGVGMEQVVNPRTARKARAAVTLPEVLDKPDPDSPLATTEYENIKVLTNTTVEEFNRLMLAMTSWVAPDQGCEYCHNVENMADDKKYTHKVARRMLQMTRTINSKWKNHVKDTGVTCFTCHRGKPVPDNIWFINPGPKQAMRAGYRAGQNAPASVVGVTSLPFDPFTKFLSQRKQIRVVATSPLRRNRLNTLKETEATYGLMVHLSQSLGVNCTFCHNSRSFLSWEESSPQRLTAFHGIRMVRELNATYLDPLKPVYPKIRLGPLGDAPKANCATCHAGVNKPLYGAQMLKDYPKLGGDK